MKRQYSQLPQVAFSILLALSLKPRHGYEIIQQVEEDSNGKVKLGPGALYTSIKQLHTQGLITETEDSTDSRRRYYRLTSDGQQALNAEIEYYHRAVDLARQRQAAELGGSHA
jgi:DNA-binding PadR family transcriptional regulator